MVACIVYIFVKAFTFSCAYIFTVLPQECSIWVTNTHILKICTLMDDSITELTMNHRGFSLSSILGYSYAFWKP